MRSRKGEKNGEATSERFLNRLLQRPRSRAGEQRRPQPEEKRGHGKQNGQASLFSPLPHSEGSRLDAWRKKKEGDRPKRNKFKASSRTGVVAGAFLAASATNRATAGVRLQRHEDLGMIIAETSLGVNEACLLFDVVENSLQLHRSRWGLLLWVLQQHQ